MSRFVDGVTVTHRAGATYTRGVDGGGWAGTAAARTRASAKSRRLLSCPGRAGDSQHPRVLGLDRGGSPVHSAAALNAFGQPFVHGRVPHSSPRNSNPSAAAACHTGI